MKQLTSLDAQFLAIESASTYGHVGGLAVFDPSSAPDGALTAEDLKRVLEARIDQLPPFRQRLAPVPFGLDHPYWINDPDFDLDFHVRESAVPPPGSDAQLADSVARMFARPLDRRRPLWEIYVIHGLPEGRVALLTKFHHSALDGVSGAEILQVLFDLEPDTPAADHEIEPWLPDRRPGELEMLGRGALGAGRAPLRALASLPAAVTGVLDFPGAGLVPGVPTLQRLRARAFGGDHAKAMLDVRAARAPRTPFNGPVGPHRRFAFASLSLDDVKAIKNAHGVKVNDVVVSLCAGAVRQHLLGRGALPREPLVALIPVSVRTDEEQGTFGNKVSGMILPVATDVADPVQRLMRTHELLDQGKDQQAGLPASLMTDVSNFLPPALFTRAARLALEVTSRTRPALNLIVSNVPGPPIPLYCAGATLLAHYPVSVVTDGVGLNITVMSYRDHLDVGIIVDRDMLDDAWELQTAMSHALDELRARTTTEEPVAS